MEDEELLGNIRARAAELHAGLEKLASRFDFIREVRGEGLIVGIDLAVPGGPFVEEALRSGLLINCTHDHILRLLPPFIIRRKDVVEFLEKFERVLARTAKSAAKSSAAVAKAAPSAQPLILAAAR
jgi:acetylornithine/succinyldiaminopimelate/putrescine aminotransferase